MAWRTIPITYQLAVQHHPPLVQAISRQLRKSKSMWRRDDLACAEGWLWEYSFNVQVRAYSFSEAVANMAIAVRGGKRPPPPQRELWVSLCAQKHRWRGSMPITDSDLLPDFIRARIAAWHLTGDL
jgi:hypothetical protein